MNNYLTMPRSEKNNGWHYRGYLPHFDGGCVPQFITFRLYDSLPASKLNEWAEELKLQLPKQEKEYRKRIEEFLDRGIGELFLLDKRIAAIVEDSLLFFDAKRYQLHAWVVMPNHVHVLLSPKASDEIEKIVHSWKSYSAKKANLVLHRDGEFWQKDYYDRYIRNYKQLEAVAKYIEYNPVKAGLCESPEQWEFSSAFRNASLAHQG